MVDHVDQPKHDDQRLITVHKVIGFQPIKMSTDLTVSHSGRTITPSSSFDPNIVVGCLWGRAPETVEASVLDLAMMPLTSDRDGKDLDLCCPHAQRVMFWLEWP